MRVVAIADSDSYLKWAGSLLAGLPETWERALLVVRTPVAPSATQRSAALSLSGIDPDAVPHVEIDEIAAHLSEAAPDVVLVGTRGPVARVLIRVAAGLARRPVIVSGLPGISIPATRKALVFRLQADLFVLHSRREIREFTELSRANGWDHRFGLATLPFIEPSRSGGRTGTDLVFAAQAVVPRERADRERVARLLRAAALARPDRRVVVKVRAVRGERQTHDEEDGYPELIAEAGPLPPNLVVSSGAMSAALDAAEGLVTLSSTAALEAIARGIPVIALDTFGVSDELINRVFVGSGMLAGEAAVVGREFAMPSPAWFEDNYFHDPAVDDVIDQITDLVSLRRAGLLPTRSAFRTRGGRLRLAWERRRAFGTSDRSPVGLLALAIGLPARAVLRILRRVRGIAESQTSHEMSGVWRGKAATRRPASRHGGVERRSRDGGTVRR